MNIIHPLAYVFLPYYVKELTRIYLCNINLAHYTKLDAGISILNNKEIWLRNITKMNDDQEVKCGLKLFKDFLYNNYSLYNDLINIMDSIGKNKEYWNNLLDELIENFYEKYAKHTYILSLTEYKYVQTINLDLFYRFCRGKGITFVFNSKFVNPYSKILNLSRVVYFNELEFRNEFIKLISSIKQNVDYLKSDKHDIDLIEHFFKQAIFFAILSIKSPEFKIENEWRIVYCDKINNKDSTNEIIVEDNKKIKGQIEKIYKIKFDKLGKFDLVKNIIAVNCTKKEIANIEDKINNWKYYNGIENINITK